MLKLKQSILKGILGAGLLFASVGVQAQKTLPYAVVDKKMVYANARTSDKKVIDRMVKGDLLLIGEESKGNPGWMEMKYIAKSDDAKPFERYIGLDQSGIVNKERVVYLDNLPKYTATKQRNSIVFTDPRPSKLASNKRNRITVDIANYDPSYRKMEKDADGKIISLDKDIPWGTGGVLPEKMTQLKSVRVNMDEVGSIFPREAVKNMFQPTTDFENEMGVYELDPKTLFFYMKNGEGDAAYTSIWTIKEGKVVSQIITTP